MTKQELSDTIEKIRLDSLSESMKVENLKPRMSDFANENGTIDIGALTAFLLAESTRLNSEIMQKVLQSVFSFD